MRERLKYYISIVLFLLLNITVAEAHITVGNIVPESSSNCSSIISQEQATKKAACKLCYIYSHSPREITTGDVQSLLSKSILRSFLNLRKDQDNAKVAYQADKSILIHLHPDPIGYYIFTLKKIIL